MLRRFPGVRAWEETSDVLQNVLLRLDRTLQAVGVALPPNIREADPARSAA